MAGEPSDNSAEKNSTTSMSGGANVEAQHDVNIGGDVVGRDKIITAGDDVVMGDQVEAETYIEHATIVTDRTNRIWLALLAGVVGVIVVALSIIVIRSANTPAPVLTVIVPRNEPTGTSAPNTPTPTATPIFAENVPYHVAIAKFNQLSDHKLAIEQRLEDDLDQQLQAAGLNDEVEVKVVSQPAIESAEDAQQLADSTRSNVVIWGFYDDVGIRLRILFGSGVSLSETVPEVARFGELALASTGSPTSTLSFYITSTLPANTSFLSFYVLGHLYYLSNQYAKGHAAFDTAMQQLPKTVAVENEALLHFFNARVTDTTTLEDAVSAICEYARAIAIDREHMFEAYNNLGILAARYSYVIGFQVEDQSDRIKSCINQAQITFEASELFSEALHIRPDLAIARYNLGTLDWNTSARCGNSLECDSRAGQLLLQNRERAESEFSVASKVDPSIPGAHIGLGNMAMWRGDFVAATDQFSMALSLMPQSPEVAMNLGQALALAGRESEAEAAYRRAIRNAPENSMPSLEAHLALGILYHRQGNLARANMEYQQVQQAQAQDPDFHPGYDEYGYSVSKYYAARALQLALIHYEIDASKRVSASQRIQLLRQGREAYERALGGGLAPDPRVARLDTYLPWLIDAASGLTTTVRPQGFYTVTTDDPVPPFIAWSQGDVAAMAWYDLVKECKSSGEDDFRTWGSGDNPCLPTDPQKRISAVFEIIQRRMQQRLFFTDVIPAGTLTCPYIFTYDDQSGQWSLDTTILYKLVGLQAEAAQARKLSRFNGQVLLREVEAETSYVDMIAVRLITADGREIILKLNDPLLGAADRQYLVLHQGDQRLLTFNVPDDALPAREVWLVAAGYYIPMGR